MVLGHDLEEMGHQQWRHDTERAERQILGWQRMGVVPKGKELVEKTRLELTVQCIIGKLRIRWAR